MTVVVDRNPVVAAGRSPAAAARVAAGHNPEAAAAAVAVAVEGVAAVVDS